MPPPKRFEEVPNFTAVLGLICVLGPTAKFNRSIVGSATLDLFYARFS